MGMGCMATLPSLDRNDLVVVLVSAILLFFGFVVYPVDPFRMLIVFIVFSIYVGWMAYILQKWMFDDPSES